ncbi:MAG: hypothetical protein ABUL71_03620, partial [Gemmatimonadota bacterium]
LLAGLTLLALLAPASLRAQVTVELGPLVGVYAPIGSFGPYDATSIAFPQSPSELTAFAWGGEARLWINRRIGVQLQGAVAKRSVGGGVNTPAGWTSTPKDAQIVLASAQLVYRPSPAGPVTLSAGIGTVRRSGDAFYVSPQQQVTGFNPMGGTVGAGYDVDLGHRLVASLGVTAYLYSLDMHDRFGQKWEQGFQVDLLPHLTMAWRPVR